MSRRWRGCSNWEHERADMMLKHEGGQHEQMKKKEIVVGEDGENSRKL